MKYRRFQDRIMAPCLNIHPVITSGAGEPIAGGPEVIGRTGAGGGTGRGTTGGVDDDPPDPDASSPLMTKQGRLI